MEKKHFGKIPIPYLCKWHYWKWQMTCLICREPRHDVSIAFFFEVFWVIKEQMHALGMLFLSEEGASHPKHFCGERSTYCINYTEIFKKLISFHVKVPYPGPAPTGISLMAQMAGTDVVCGVSATTGKSRWCADPEEKAVCCDGFWLPGAPSLFCPLLILTVTTAEPVLCCH